MGLQLSLEFLHVWRAKADQLSSWEWPSLELVLRSVLEQGAEDRGMRLPSANSMPTPSFSVDDIPMEEFHGELLHYSRPASLQSHGTSPTETPLRCGLSPHCMGPPPKGT